MRVFLAGATGAIGRRLVPMPVAGGHDVGALGRHARGAARTTPGERAGPRRRRLHNAATPTRFRTHAKR